ncbi:MAG: AraC family transcriptional regulator [Clostridia bacterium]|nr:AraC family transcriptional regulator [Clostridia bacterium]
MNNNLVNNFSVREIGFNSVPPELKQIHTRDIYIIHYVTKGKGIFMGNSFSEGDCYFVVPGELEIIEADAEEPYESAWIMVKGRRAKELIGKCDFPEYNSVFRFEKAKECGELIREYLFAENYENEFVEACKLEELFYKIMALHFEYYSEPPKQTDNKAYEIAEFIEKNYGNDIKIGDLCNIFYLSKNYLCTIFKREYGVTPQEYLISYRMEKARQFLALGDQKLSIAEISFSIGIDNPLYFSRCFHKRFGVSPTEYRKNINKNT